MQTNQNPCAILASLNNLEARLLGRLFSKWEGLHRLADLLERAGDISSLIPNPAYLVPLNALDLSVYDRIRASCPMLGLPAADLGGLSDLRRRLENAYWDLLRRLQAHPWNRLMDLDRELGNFLKKLGPVNDWSRCLNTLCESFGSEDAAAYRAIRQQFDEIINAPGEVKSVLSQTATQKAEQLRATTSEIRRLLVTSN